jgi:exodeoxyribonuclease V gamma subunit
VGELLDIVERTGGPAAREQVVTRHPLQPFDPRNFAPPRPWGFDRTTLEGARALSGPRVAPAPFLSGPLQARDEPVVELADLVAFAERPVRTFLRRRLDIAAAEYGDEVEDALPVELDGLGVWGVGQRLLEARLAGAEPRAAILAEIARGTLPPGVLGKPVVDRVSPMVEEIVRHVEPGDVRAVDVKLSVGGRALRGTVPEVRGVQLRTVTFARIGARQRISAWVRLLALSASTGRACSAVTIGRGAVVRIAPVEPEAARRELASLLELYDLGMREPLPIACLTSAAFASGGELAARQEWESEWSRDREDAAPEHVLVYGRRLPFAELAADPRFAEFALRLWKPLLERER